MGNLAVIIRVPFLCLRGSKTPKGNHEKPVEEESSRLACLCYQVAEDMRASTHSWYRLNGENVNSYPFTSFIAEGFHREEQQLFFSIDYQIGGYDRHIQ